MFNSQLEEKIDKLTTQLGETVSLLRALVNAQEANNKSWRIVADHVAKLDNPNVAAFGRTR